LEGYREALAEIGVTSESALEVESAWVVLQVDLRRFLPITASTTKMRRITTIMLAMVASSSLSIPVKPTSPQKLLRISSSAVVVIVQHKRELPPIFS